jgi:hypothetical protein
MEPRDARHLDRSHGGHLSLATPSPRTAPEVPRHDPEDPVGGPDDRTPSRDQRGELLAEGQVLDHQVAACAHV